MSKDHWSRGRPGGGPAETGMRFCLGGLVISSRKVTVISPEFDLYKLDHCGDLPHLETLAFEQDDLTSGTVGDSTQVRCHRPKVRRARQITGEDLPKGMGLSGSGVCGIAVIPQHGHVVSRT